MKNIIAVFLLFFGLLGTEKIWGQTAPDIKVGGPTNLSSLITPSSTASSLTRSLDVPVNLYTGKPQIAIPLYTLPGHQLSLPVSLSYNAGGDTHRRKSLMGGFGLVFERGWGHNAWDTRYT